MADTIANEIETNPEKGSPEYNEKMVERFDEGFKPQVEANTQSFEEAPEVAAMPEGGLDKFFNKESGEYDWPNHVKELEYRIEQNKPDDKPTVETEPSDRPQVDWDSMAQAVGEKKELSPENKKALMDFGLPEHVIDSYMGLLEVGQEYAQQRTIEYAGGEEQINNIFDWAQKNLSEEEIKNYNDILDTPNWRMAIDSLKVASGIGSVDTETNSGDPQLIEGNAAQNSGVGFASKQEMISAMADPKYKADPAFRNQVRLRVGRSNF